VVLEIDRFNLELNLTPAPLAGRPFAAMASELDQARSRSGSGSPGPTRWSWTPTTSAWRGPTPPSRSTCGRLSRVAFGTGWVKGGPLELLEESVRMHEPVLPVVGPEPPLERLGDGGVPALDELRLHQGMVWRWNRAIYDPAGGGHLRSSCGPCPRARP